MCKIFASPRFLALVAVVVLFQAFVAPYTRQYYLSKVRRSPMSWRPRQPQPTANISIQEVQGMLQASSMQTDIQMAKELEKKGWIVKKN
jgi:hypothetical protein